MSEHTLKDVERALHKNDGDGPDLSQASLLINDGFGVYIPQMFAQQIKRECVSGVSDEDYKVLEAGPDHEHYWDAWADVTDNAKVTDPKRGECYLYQDGDLWLVPVEKEEPKPETKRVMGHIFRPMTQQDWYGFSGADPGSWICYVPHEEEKETSTILLLSPSGNIHELVYTAGGEDYWRDWACVQSLPQHSPSWKYEKAETGT